MEKTREYWMIECLFDEIQGPLASNRFSQWEMQFITDLNARFFNDENYKLSDKQLDALEKIWEK